MKNLFSNKDAEKLADSEHKNDELISVIKRLGWQIEALEAEREEQHHAFADIKALNAVKAQLDNATQENKRLRTELEKVLKSLENTRSAFERVKRQRDRLKLLQNVD